MKINKHLVGPSNDPISKSTILFCFGLQANLVILVILGALLSSPRAIFQMLSFADCRSVSILSFNPWKSTTLFARLFPFFDPQNVNIEWSNRGLPVWGMVIPSWMGSPHNQNPHSATLWRQPASPGLREKKGQAYCKEQGGYSEQVVAQQENVVTCCD